MFPFCPLHILDHLGRDHSGSNTAAFLMIKLESQESSYSPFAGRSWRRESLVSRTDRHCMEESRNVKQILVACRESRPLTVKSCRGPEALPYLQANKLDRSCFMDAGKKI